MNKKALHVLGTGVAIVTHYYNTAFVLDNGEDYFLVDGMGGIDVLRQFAHFHIPWEKLKGAFLSHEHTDHFLGMVYVVRMIAHYMRLGLYEGEFHLYGHDNVLRKLENVCRNILQPIEVSFLGKRLFFDVVEDREERDIWGCHFTFFDIHSTKAKQFGFRMIWENKSIVFLGDEPLSETCADLCMHADYLLSEAFCLYEERDIHTPYRYHHSTVMDAAKNAERFQAKNLVLWHTEDTTTYGRRKELYTAEAQLYYHGKVYVPEDGETILL